MFVGILAALVLHWPYLVILALPVFLFSQLAFIVLAFFFRCPVMRKAFVHSRLGSVASRS